MEISWFGSTSFLIKNSIGKRILLDPLTMLTKHSIDSFTPNIVTLSTLPFKNNYLSSISKNIKIISNIDPNYTSDICTVSGYSTFTDKFKGKKRGTNMIFHFIIDNISLAHLGFLGELPSLDIIEILKDIDILFVPIGNNITLPVPELLLLLKKIKPKIIIPMNYTAQFKPTIFKGLDDFILQFKPIEFLNLDNFTINSDTLLNFSKGTVISLSENSFKK